MTQCDWGRSAVAAPNGRAEGRLTQSLKRTSEAAARRPSVSSAAISSVNSQKFREQRNRAPARQGRRGPRCFWGAPKGRNRSRASVRRVSPWISQRRKRLAFAPAASDVRFSDCVKRPSALALERRLRATPVTLGSCLMVRRSHGYPDFLPRLTHRRDVCVAWIRLPSVVTTWRHSRPNTASVKLNSFADPIALGCKDRCGEQFSIAAGASQRKQSRRRERL